ncbi:TetR/AcrR family transcriptional regulator [Parashewanella curva]|uniref:TetR/AcrR family transcriptional regulator n=1 Tax=Parashewanella curva TaxID=2338552 RepID=A0A3L8Q1Y7_9GAMM|nr:TetR/AcrR family transcriptional regulator [Parashewanella curva]RLV61651.1 TetR/AcrR family transcriptional regulator [Parashewanella curva]
MCPAPRFTVEQQQQMILDAAAQVIESSSLMDFKMTAIAKQAGLSVGSLYKCVQTKEDMIIALACEKDEHFYQLFKRIFDTSLTMPQKLIAFILLDPNKSQKYSFDLDLDILSKSEAVIRRCSPMWKARILELENKMSELCRQKNVDCFNSGEFLGKDLNAIYELSVGHWAMSIGFKQIKNHIDVVSQHLPRAECVAATNVENNSIVAMTHFINAHPWKDPLTPEAIEQTKLELEALGYR